MFFHVGTLQSGTFSDFWTPSKTSLWSGKQETVYYMQTLSEKEVGMVICLVSFL
uniref:Uncharacterized protein n=1 Tax=Anguilla anguilla TaxID=7936 RepID=A0A0E9XJW5_ANGAN